MVLQVAHVGDASRAIVARRKDGSNLVDTSDWYVQQPAGRRDQQELQEEKEILARWQGNWQMTMGSMVTPEQHFEDLLPTPPCTRTGDRSPVRIPHGRAH